MSTQLTKDAKVVLKLDLGEDGLRRIPLLKLWDEATQTVSYNQLIKLILSHKKFGPKAVELKRVTVTVTYTDEDGDEITISSGAELVDAFEQYSNFKPPVLRAKAIVERHKNVDILVKEEVKQELRKERQLLNEVRREVQREQRNLGRSNSDSNKAASPTVVRLPTVAPPKKVFKIVNASKCSTANNARRNATTSPAGCDPNFIHGRHTCDGCLMTPIIGLRYRADDLPDYDLCSRCHAKYTGQDILFKAVQLNHDKHFQERWQRLHGRQCGSIRTQGPKNGRPNKTLRLPQVASGTQTNKVIDGMDDALKEAIRRSLIDAWPVQKNKVREDKSCKEKIAKEEEPDIVVASAEEVESGNEKKHVVPVTVHRHKDKKMENPQASKEGSRGRNIFDERNAGGSKEGIKMTKETEDNRSEETNLNAEDEKVSVLPPPVVDVVIEKDLSAGIDDAEKEDDKASAVVKISEEDEDHAEGSDSDCSAESKKEWQIVSDDEMIAVAAQMLGSVLCESDSDASINCDSKHGNE